MTRAELALDLEAYLRDRRRRVEEALGRVLDRALGGVPADVAEVIRYACEGPAKRIRPILTCAVSEALGGAHRVEGLACAVEVIHGYSLVHDDLPGMDDDDLRRGKPTAHRAFGAARAARAAAAMIPLAFEVLAGEAERLGFPTAVRKAIALDLAAGAGPCGMVGGQWLDLEWSEAGRSPAAIRQAHDRKTAALFVAAARIGARAARADEVQIQAIGDYARHLGLAFQLRDDALDAEGGGEPGPAAAGAVRAEGGVARGAEGAARHSEAAVACLRSAAVSAPVLEALARFAAERDR